MEVKEIEIFTCVGCKQKNITVYMDGAICDDCSEALDDYERVEEEDW